MRFSAYGAHIDSDFPLAGLPVASGEPTAALRLKSGCGHYSQSDREQSKAPPAGWRPITCDGGENPVFRIDGVGDFHLCPPESEIRCTLAPDVSMDSMRYWLMHFVIPVYLLLDARYDFLHASAVDIGGGAVAFLADAMGGKSTLASFFVEQGHALLTDDHLGIVHEHDFLAMPSAPFVRPYRRLEDLGQAVERFSSGPLPLRAVYLLKLGEEPARVVPVAGAPVTTALARNRRLIVSKEFSDLAKERFQRLAALSVSVPVAELRVPRDLARLPEVHRTVLADLGEPHDPL